MAVNTTMGQHVLDETKKDVWTFGPVPDTGPENLDTGEEILSCLARLCYLVPMQQARLQMMEIHERIRTEQRKWLKDLVRIAEQQGIIAGFHQHNLRKAGYSNKSITG